MPDLVPLRKPFSMFAMPTTTSKHKVMLIGEAPGEEEEKFNQPFIGPSGKLLTEVLSLAGWDRRELYITNVFTERPPENDIKKHWTVTKTDLRKLGHTETGRLPQLNKRFLLPQYEDEWARLRHEIATIKPDLIICLGGTALWALIGDGRITNARGNFFQTEFGCPGIATFHPAAVLRQYENRPIMWADLSKARRFLNGTLPPPVHRKLWIDPTLEEIEHVYHKFSSRPVSFHDPLGVDIETDPRIDQITTISYGFYDEAICIPFYDKATLADRCNYWATAEEEADAWIWVKRFGELPHPMVGQNFLYDHQYLLEGLDIRVRVSHDTAILQHATQPELPKALGVLASLYLNEPSWKFMRESTKDDNKADD